MWHFSTINSWNQLLDILNMQSSNKEISFQQVRSVNSEQPASKFLFKTAIWEQWKQSSFGSNPLNTQYITYIALFSSVIL